MDSKPEEDIATTKHAEFIKEEEGKKDEVEIV
jgi:hypothetical protein